MGAPGCDDAPVVTVPLGDVSRRFTLIMPYYENPGFFSQQILNWFGRIPEMYTSNMRLIIVDDGSPEHPAQDVFKAYWPVDSHVQVRLFRIDVDVRWNWLAARNIGAHYADTEWIMLTDMDHVLHTDVMIPLVYGQHNPQKIYRFSRKEHTGEMIHPHPNSWFMTKEMYWKVGGYDEALSGHYGTDGEYRRRCAATARINIMSEPLIRHERIGDSSTTHYLRKQPEDAKGKQLIKARPKKGWKPKILSFPYHEVQL